MFETLLADLARVLDAAGLPYMVIGGQAVLQYGEPRLTRDVDITLGVAPDRLGDVIDAVGPLGLRPLVEPEGFVAETLVLPCEESTTGIRVDLVFSFPGYERAAMDRTNPVEIRGGVVRFASVEDLLVHKLVAGRPRDVEDVRGILLRQPGADLDYVRRWVAEFDTALGLSSGATLARLLDEIA